MKGIKKMSLFIDTSAFYALEDPSDKDHHKALKYETEIKYKENIRLITSSYILDETLTLIKIKLGYEASIKFGEKIRKSKIIRVIHISEELEEKAWEIFIKYKDKGFSFTDCTSFALMKRYKIKSAFTFDKHFSQFGFEVFSKI